MSKQQTSVKHLIKLVKLISSVWGDEGQVHVGNYRYLVLQDQLEIASYARNSQEVIADVMYHNHETVAAYRAQPLLDYYAGVEKKIENFVECKRIAQIGLKTIQEKLREYGLFLETGNSSQPN